MSWYPLTVHHVLLLTKYDYPHHNALHVRATAAIKQRGSSLCNITAYFADETKRARYNSSVLVKPCSGQAVSIVALRCEYRQHGFFRHRSDFLYDSFHQAFVPLASRPSMSHRESGIGGIPKAGLFGSQSCPSDSSPT